MLICLLSGDPNPNTASVSVDAAQKIKHTCTIYTFTFYSLCSEIAGSIISFITLLDMMHQKFIVYRNTLNRTQGFTMDTRLTVLPIALTTVNDSFKIFCFSFFFWLFHFLKLLFLPLVALLFTSFCPSAHRPPPRLTVTFYFANAVKVC